MSTILGSLITSVKSLVDCDGAELSIIDDKAKIGFLIASGAKVETRYSFLTVFLR
jgi:hypothetical protein